LPRDWAEELEKMARNDFKNSAKSVGASVKESEIKISVISQKLERLLNGYLEQDIEKEIYRVEKVKLILQKKSLEEEMTSLSHKHNDWLEPLLDWLKVAQNLNGIARDTDPFAKKVKAKEIFGSNLLLGEKLVRASAPKILNSFGKMGGNQWDALRASHLLASKKPFSSFVVGDRGLESYRFGTGLVSCLIGIKQDILDLFSSSTQAEQSACYRPNKNPLKADVVCGR
jgi:hypothetical protein